MGHMTDRRPTAPMLKVFHWGTANNALERAHHRDHSLLATVSMHAAPKL